jgi:tetratricopeptide (TPR) repeat protein
MDICPSSTSKSSILPLHKEVVIDANANANLPITNQFVVDTKLPTVVTKLQSKSDASITNNNLKYNYPSDDIHSCLSSIISEPFKMDEIPRNGISLKGIWKFINDLKEVTRSLSSDVSYKGFDPRFVLRPFHKHELKLVELEKFQCLVCMAYKKTWRSCIECGYYECLECYKENMKDYDDYFTYPKDCRYHECATCYFTGYKDHFKCPEENFKCPDDCLDKDYKRLKYYKECLKAFEGSNPTTENIAYLSKEYLTKSTQSTYADLLNNDPEFVGPATIFISHAWSMPFNALIASIIDLDKTERLRDSTRIPYFWLDVLVNNQHKTTNRPFEWWQTVFKDNIKQIGNTALILEWENPRPLTRVWCVWEMLCSSLETNIRFQVVMPPNSRVAFQRALVGDFDALTTKTCTVDLRNAEAYHGGECLEKNSDGICCDVTSGKIMECPNDKARIFKACETAIEGGIEVVNQRVIQLMIDWMISYALKGSFELKRLHTLHKRYVYTWGEPFYTFLYSDAYLIADPRFIKAIEARRTLLRDTHPSLLRLINKNAVELHTRGKFSEARSSFIDALNSCRRTLGDIHPHTFCSINNMAVCFSKEGIYIDAEKLFLEALEGRRLLLGDKHSDTLTSISNFAAFLHERDHTTEFENIYIFDDMQDVPKVDLVSISRLFNVRYNVAEASNNNVAIEAEVLCAEALKGRSISDCTDMQDRFVNHMALCVVLNNMALFLNDRGEYEEAEAHLLRSVAGFRTTHSGNPHTLTSISNMAKFYNDRGKYDEAKPLYIEALKGRCAILGDTHYDTLRSMKNYADFLCNKGISADLTEAATLAKSALTGLHSSLGEFHIASLNALRVYGRVRYLQGFLTDSIQILKQALLGLQKLNHNEGIMNATRDLLAAESALQKEERLRKR